MTVMFAPTRLALMEHDIIHQLRRHAEITPQQVAILTSDGAWSYQRLYNEVLRWQAALSQHVQDRAVVCLERSPQMVIILLALLSLEVTYIPVESNIPTQRLQHILTDSGAKVLLHDDALASCDRTWPCVAIHIKRLHCPDLARYSQAITQHFLPQRLAYIIYTSGSTGKPKGVAISRLALNNFLTSMSHYFLTEAHALLLATTTVAFDIAVLELFLPLWQGRTVLLALHAQHKNPTVLQALLQQYPVTLMQSTPSLWNMLFALGWRGKADLTVLSGGEPLTPTLAEKLLSTVAAVWNMYGPTEATVWCALKRLSPNQPITVGRPIDNMDMHVLDAQYQPLPAYAKGELYISGLGLAQGYVNRDDLTQQRFIAAADVLGGRIYQVGDIACRTAEGEFIIFGRSDNQIKLHGFRIEPEEVEAVITQFPGVYQCAVIAKNEQLVAFISLQPGVTAFVEEQFTQHLQAYLPEYMVPRRLLYLEALPLSQNGKVERNALAELVTTDSTAKPEDSHLTTVQLKMQAIWAKELQLSAVGLHANFFELGGHSLIAARIIASVAEVFGRQMRLQDCYQRPTIAELCEHLAHCELYQAIELPQSPMGHAWFALTDFQWMLWLSKKSDPRLRVFNVVGRRRLQGPLDAKALDLALQTVLAQHDSLRYQIHRYLPLQKLAASGTAVTWQTSSLTDLATEIFESKLLASLDELFYSQQWPAHAAMIEARLFYLPQQQVEMQICLSHLLADEQTLNQFFKQLSLAYQRALSDGSEPAAIDASTAAHSYHTYAMVEQQRCQQNSARDVAFWREYFRDSGLLPLPKQHIVLDFDKQNVKFSTTSDISATFKQKLLTFCQKNRLTMNDALTAAAAVALQICCANQVDFTQHNIYVNTVRSSRDQAGYDDLLGCCLRMQAIKLNLAGHAALSEMAQQVQQALIATSEYQYAPSLIKMAALKHVPARYSALLQQLLKLSFGGLSRLAGWSQLSPAVVRALGHLAPWDRRQHFLLNINVLNSFFTDGALGANECCGAALLPTPARPPHVIPLRSVLDVWFFQEEQQAKLLVAGNISVTFREHFIQVLLALFNDELPAEPRVRQQQAELTSN